MEDAQGADGSDMTREIPGVPTDVAPRAWSEAGEYAEPSGYATFSAEPAGGIQAPAPEPKRHWYDNRFLVIVGAVVIGFFGLAILGSLLPNQSDTPSAPATSASSTQPSPLASQPPTPAAAPDPNASEGQVDDAAFIATLQLYHVNYPSRSDAISTAHDVCNQLESGKTYNQVAGSVLEAGYDPAPAGALMGAAIGVYCEDQDAGFKAWNESNKVATPGN